MSPRISIRLLAAQSDQRLTALAGAGHERAFEALVHRYRRPLLRYARGMGLGEARAEDVVQQALLRAWVALSRGVVVRDARSWLYRIVHNLAVNALRGVSGAQAELTQAAQDKAALARPSNLERRIAMRDALGEVAALPRMQRQAIFLTAVDGQSHEEVAGTLGITQGALRGLLYRARATLRSAAAALTPQPLLELAARGGEASGPATERALELTGAGGLLLKAGVAVVTAGALATGASVVAPHGHRGGDGRMKTAPSLSASAGQVSRLASGGASEATIPRAALGHDRELAARPGRRGSTHAGRGEGRHPTHRASQRNHEGRQSGLAIAPADRDREGPSTDGRNREDRGDGEDRHRSRSFELRHADRRHGLTDRERHGDSQATSSGDGAVQLSAHRGGGSPIDSSGPYDDASTSQTSNPSSDGSGFSGSGSDQRGPDPATADAAAYNP